MVKEVLTINEVLIQMDANSQNEGFARLCAAAFVAPLNPTVSDLTEVKTAVSEAVTNAILHGYEGRGYLAPKVTMHMSLQDDVVTIRVKDEGAGIGDVTLARTPLFTTRPDDERSGMGFTIMESFMDSVEVMSAEGYGTEVVMRKRLSNGQDAATD